MAIKIGKKLRSRIHLAYGVATLTRLVPANLLWRSTGGTMAARYCYSVWLRHLVKAAKYGLPIPPASVAELGPGDSLGIGLCALLTGTQRYLALDVVRYADMNKSLPIFDELLNLIMLRTPIPDASEFPEIKPPLESYEFPANLLTDEILSTALAPERVAAIRDCLSGRNAEPYIRYMVPWDASRVVNIESLDFLFSQAVMEHVDDVAHTYQTMSQWLKPGGFCSHQVDFKSHNLTPAWDGYRAFPEWKWKLMRGRRPYLINRQPFSQHLLDLATAGFTVLDKHGFQMPPETLREHLAPRWRHLDDIDRKTSGAYFLARK